MTNVVVDASVAVKWCLPFADEDLLPQAEEILDRCRRGEIGFLVPDLFWVEVANALWKAVRKKRIPVERAQTAFSLVRELDIPTISSVSLLPDALQLAVGNDRTVYDCLYVVLAVQSKAELITADERLANALAARLPVKWLGAFDSGTRH